MTDLETAFAALSGKRLAMDKLWRYYDGDQPLKYSSERLRTLFDAIDVRFIENFAAGIVNATLDRVQLEHLAVDGNPTATELLAGILADTDLDLDADDIHLATLVCGEAFVVAWREPQPDGTTATQAHYHDPRLCHVQYDPANPLRKMWAAKWWAEDGGTRLNLYYPDRLEYYAAKKTGGDLKASDFAPLADTPVVENPTGVVPVFHFRRERRTTAGELTVDLLSLQDAVNKLLSDLMVSAEFTAIRQRYIISNADENSIKAAANEHWLIPAGDGMGEPTKVGEFAEGDLSRFLSAINDIASAMASISRTPKHYFFRSGGDPSGEALLTQEAPHTKKVSRFIRRQRKTWQRLGAFLLALEGIEIPSGAIDPVYEAPGSVLPETQATVRKSSVDSGIPLRTVLRREG